TADRPLWPGRRGSRRSWRHRAPRRHHSRGIAACRPASAHHSTDWLSADRLDALRPSLNMTGVVLLLAGLLVAPAWAATCPLLAGERHGCSLLLQAERLLEHAARSEAGARSPLAHVSSLAFNLALGLTLGYGLNRRDGAARNTTLGIIIGELMIHSRPTHAIR